MEVIGNSFLIDLETQILNRSEYGHVEFKQSFKWDEKDKDKTPISRQLKHRIIKTILCFANRRDGGRIIIGVDESNHTIGMNDADFESFDATAINELLEKFADPPHTVKVSKPILTGVVDSSLQEKKIVVIDVLEFDNVPIVCKKDYGSPPEKNILVEGMLYYRSDKANVENKVDPIALREVLNRATIKNGEKLLSQIVDLLQEQGYLMRNNIAKVNPMDDYYKPFLEEAQSRVIEDANGFWKITTKPKEYKQERVNNDLLYEIIQRSQVSLRGWYFPHVSSTHIQYLQDGVGSYVNSPRHQESFSAYTNGLFTFHRVFWEDLENSSYKQMEVKAFDFKNVIWSITEFFIFFKRFYEDIAPGEEIEIQISANNIKGRQIGTTDFSLNIGDDWFSKHQNQFAYSKTIQTTVLSISHIDIANECIRKLFRIFGWPDANPEVIKSWQIQLIEKKY
jgi:hypothetical protein